jgi:hypothetical protein
MASPPRGLARERHTRIKAVTAALATGGFVVAWLGFSTSHAETPGDAVAQVTNSEAALVLAQTPTPTVAAPATGDSSSAAGPTATTAAPTATIEAQPSATSAPTITRSRTSRGS